MASGPLSLQKRALRQQFRGTRAASYRAPYHAHHELMIFATFVTTATASFEGNSSHCFRQDGGETMMDAFTALLDLLLFFSDFGDCKAQAKRAEDADHDMAHRGDKAAH